MLEEAEDKLDQVEQQRKARLEALTSTASQVNTNVNKIIDVRRLHPRLRARKLS